MHTIWDNLKQIRRGKVIVAMISIVIGLIFLFFPLDSILLVTRIFGAGLLISGVYMILIFIAGSRGGLYTGGLVGGILICGLGLWILMRPEGLAGLIPTIIGLFVLASGLTNLFETIELGRAKYGLWWLSFLMALATVLMGILLIFKPFGVIDFIVRLVGISMIFDAVSNIWIISRVSVRVKDIRRDQPIDVDAVVIDADDQGPTPQ